MISRRESQEIVNFVNRLVKERLFSFVTDGKVDFGKTTVGSVTGTQYSGGQISDNAFWNRHVNPNAAIAGTKIRVATTTTRGTVELATDGESDAGVVVQGNDSRLHVRYTDAEAIIAAKTIKLDDFTTPDDTTDLDFSTSVHGLVPKGTGVGDYLKDDGTWSPVSGGGGVDTSGTPQANDMARFVDEDTIEGRSYTEVKSDLDLEIGVDVLAQQSIGIADDNLLEVDQADAVTGEYARFTVSGLESRSKAEHLGDLNVADGADVTGSNAPQAHKTSHQNSGGDEISVSGLSGLLADDQHVLDTEVKLIKLDDFASPDDNTDLDFSTSAHGLVPKGTNVGDFLKDDGTWASVTVSGVGAHAASHTDGTDDIQTTSTAQKGIVQLDGTVGGTDGEVAKPPTSDAFYDHGVAVSGVHGVGADTICPVGTALALAIAFGG